MIPDKRLTPTAAIHAATGERIEGYEIHIGRSDGPGRARPFAHVDGRPEGAVSPDGLVEGSYLHGMFTGDAFRAAWLARMGVAAGPQAHGQVVEATLDALARHIEAHLDVSALFALAR
jgi:adenosylcobyric acid synthase